MTEIQNTKTFDLEKNNRIEKYILSIPAKSKQFRLLVFGI